jgi:hypothetical protein
MHLDIYLCYIHDKNNVSRKDKTTNNLECEEYHILMLSLPEGIKALRREPKGRLSQKNFTLGQGSVSGSVWCMTMIGLYHW